MISSSVTFHAVHSHALQEAAHGPHRRQHGTAVREGFAWCWCLVPHHVSRSAQRAPERVEAPGRQVPGLDSDAGRHLSSRRHRQTHTAQHNAYTAAVRVGGHHRMQPRSPAASSSSNSSSRLPPAHAPGGSGSAGGRRCAAIYRTPPNRWLPAGCSATACMMWQRQPGSTAQRAACGVSTNCRRLSIARHGACCGARDSRGGQL
jgi:hypothetical protein